MAGVVAVADQHRHMLFHSLGAQRGFDKVGAHAEKVDHAVVVRDQDGGELRVRHADGADREIG